MKRHDWQFSYSGKELAIAADKKASYHKERLHWWKGMKEEIIGMIKSEGIEIDEKLVMSQRSIKSSDWENSSQVSVRGDLMKKLQECTKKLSHHSKLLNEYDGWVQTLSSSKEGMFSLEHDDWLFFFGQESKQKDDNAMLYIR